LSFQDFSVDIYFQEHWTDSRLRHNNTRRVLIKDPKLFELMWHPDLYFANARTSSFHDVTSPNFFVWIYANGSVYYDCRYMHMIRIIQKLIYNLFSQDIPHGHVHARFGQVSVGQSTL
jgi:hypothetical protein